MKKAPWVKVWRDLLLEPALRRTTRRDGGTTAWTWIACLLVALECECEDHPPGILARHGEPLTAEDIADLAGLDVEKCRASLQTLESFGWIRKTPTGYLIPRYAARQESREARRIREWRARKAASAGVTRNVTCNVTSNASRNAFVTPCPDPGPDPGPDHSHAASSGETSPEDAAGRSDNNRCNYKDIPPQSPPSGEGVPEKTKKTNKASRPSREPAPAPVLPGLPTPEDVVRLYHDILPTLRRIRVLDRELASHIKSRSQDFQRMNPEASLEEQWRAYFAGVAQCPFLLGQQASPDGRIWQADLRWLVTPRNFHKVIEGRYGPAPNALSRYMAGEAAREGVPPEQYARELAAQWRSMIREGRP